MKYIILTFLWIIWCTLHSLLITPAITRRAKQFFGENFKYYRLGYNIFSLLSLIPILIYGRSFSAPILWEWSGGWQALRLLLLAGALYFFYAGSKKYYFRQFIGLKQIETGITPTGISAHHKLDTGGILSITRHPWYLGSIFFVWSIWGKLTVTNLIISTILTLYLVVGSVIEEKKLVNEYGKAYREYQKNVSILFPLKWFKQLLK